MGGLELGAREASDQNYVINLNIGKAFERSPMRTGRIAFGTCNYGNWIFVVGGLKELTQVDRGQEIPDSLSSCEDYNIVKNEWGNMPDLPEGRIGPSLLIINHVLYCIGGVGKLTNIFSFSLRGD